jgi:predicted nucleic acid-binding protein
MTIVADASPVNVLIRANRIGVLPQIFGLVMIPRTVAMELQHDRSPESVKAFVARPPEWLRIADPLCTDLIPPLDAGESAAIWLAKESQADLLLIDERDGRRVATRMGLNVMGTIGLLELAASRKLISLRESLDSLPPEFLVRISPKIIDAVIRKSLERSPE